jgi:hypothetical protein
MMKKHLLIAALTLTIVGGGLVGITYAAKTDSVQTHTVTEVTYDIQSNETDDLDVKSFNSVQTQTVTEATYDNQQGNVEDGQKGNVDDKEQGDVDDGQKGDMDDNQQGNKEDGEQNG